MPVKPGTLGLLSGAVALAVATPIAVNHDVAVLRGRRTTARGPIQGAREHVLGSLACAALAGAALSGAALGHPRAGAALAGAAAGVGLGTWGGHRLYDLYLGTNWRP